VKTQGQRVVIVQLRERGRAFLKHGCKEDQIVHLPELYRLMYVTDILSLRLW